VRFEKIDNGVSDFCLFYSGSAVHLNEEFWALLP
jgi:hypothetical protein